MVRLERDIAKNNLMTLERNETSTSNKPMWPNNVYNRLHIDESIIIDKSTFNEEAPALSLGLDTAGLNSSAALHACTVDRKSVLDQSQGRDMQA